MGINGAYVLLQASGEESWQSWGEVGRKGKETSAVLLRLAPGDLLCLHLACSRQRGSWAEAVNALQT